jgi:hypothetical protein
MIRRVLVTPYTQSVLNYSHWGSHLRILALLNTPDHLSSGGPSSNFVPTARLRFEALIGIKIHDRWVFVIPSQSWTAPIGVPILSILKYFENSGSSFSGGPVVLHPHMHLRLETLGIGIKIMIVGSFVKYSSHSILDFPIGVPILRAS